jgi:hypothetical protein
MRIFTDFLFYFILIHFYFLQRNSNPTQLLWYQTHMFYLTSICLTKRSFYFIIFFPQNFSTLFGAFSFTLIIA